jgi:hypothetical protein
MALFYPHYSFYIAKFDKFGMMVTVIITMSTIIINSQSH